jgi:hypothetical protein
MTSPEPSVICKNWGTIFSLHPLISKEDVMVNKELIRPDRVRKIPRQFNWVDGRLVRDRHLDRCSHQAAALYLFLITVGDSRGLSYYSDQTLGERLRMDGCVLAHVRLELIELGLIAYKKPLYQVLELAPMQSSLPRNGSGDDPKSLGEILQRVMEVNR